MLEGIGVGVRRRRGVDRRPRRGPGRGAPGAALILQLVADDRRGGGDPGPAHRHLAGVGHGAQTLRNSGRHRLVVGKGERRAADGAGAHLGGEAAKGQRQVVVSGIQVLVRPDREARGPIAHVEVERPATEPGDGVVLGRRSRLRRGGDRHPHLSVGGGIHGYRDRGRDAALGGGVGGRPERHREGDAQGDRDDRRRPAVAAFVVRGHLEHVVALRQSGDRVAASGFAARDVRPGRPGLAAVRAAPIRPFGGAGRVRAPGQNRLIGGGALPGGEGRAVGLGYHPGGRKRVRMRAGPPPPLSLS